MPLHAEPEAQALACNREFLVEGRLVRVFDGHLPDVAQHVRGLSLAAFRRTEVARPDTAEYKHWATEIDVHSLAAHPLFGVTSRAVRGFQQPGFAFRPYRAYVNVASFGDMLFTHTDCLEDQHDLTALWYMCERWDVEWGGETIFFDGAGEVACAVQPRPGRLVVFDGAIRHVGRPPNRICYTPRYTFAIKFAREPASPRRG